MNGRKRSEIRQLMLDYIFPSADYSFVEEVENKLQDRDFLEQTKKCYDACYEYAVQLIDADLKKVKEG